MDISQFKTNPTLENDGVWVDIGKDTTLCVARMYNSKHKAAMREALKPYKRQVLNETMDEGLAESVANDLLAKYVLLGWEGLTEDGKEVLYTREKAVEYLNIKDFKDLVVEIASNMETYRNVSAEESEKN